MQHNSMEPALHRALLVSGPSAVSACLPACVQLQQNVALHVLAEHCSCKGIGP